MTPDEVRQLCQALRAEGVRRARLSPDGAPLVLEFFPAAAAIPTDDERAKVPAPSDTTGFESALTVLQRGALGTGGQS